ncbi:unnamed protein product [Ceutorhynchus assimilis]|uniref:DUF4797 domain-containing protein n=1 Tax=Ceutorhynchus assimilis TaxID=467358 RepID=A0A9N9MV43_9CUCU|nr:unnamed protein product [Ceutorhynchus assimilis]
MLILTDNSQRSLTPSPKSEIKGIRLFRVISRKLAKRSQDDLNSAGEESGNSSSDSYGSANSNVGHSSRSQKERSISPNEISSSSSDFGSDFQTLRSRHHHSTSAESLRKVFQNLNLYHRSQSCTNTKDIKKKKEKKVPKSILRHPTTYTYVKGLSGLPTQRIPRSYTSNCSCSMHYLRSLNR